MDSLVSSIVANLYMKEMESRALNWDKGTTSSHGAVRIEKNENL